MSEPAFNAVRSSLCELNRRFLELLVTSHHGSPVDEPPHCHLRRMTITQRAALADCPYALFDLRFQDEMHWCVRLTAAPRWQVSDDGHVAAETLNFVRLALFYAWHVAHAATLAARMQLGMSEAVVNAFRATTLDRLPGLAASEAGSLSAKWSTNPAYWTLLTRAAATSDAAALRRAQLYGLQLAAGSRLASE